MGAATVVLLGGLGQNREVWDRVTAALPAELDAVVCTVPIGEGFSFDSATEHVRAYLDAHAIARPHLCGLSLGGMIGIHFAATHPDRVDRLMLSGAQVRPNPFLMRVQRTIMPLLPARAVAHPGLSKRQVLATLDAIYGMDLRADLARITAPTLVMCGGRDVVNVGPARVMAAGIADAELAIIPGVGHEWNVSHPKRFAAQVARFAVPGGPGA